MPKLLRPGFAHIAIELSAGHPDIDPHRGKKERIGGIPVGQDNYGPSSSFSDKIRSGGKRNVLIVHGNVIMRRLVAQMIEASAGGIREFGDGSDEESACCKQTGPVGC